MADVSKVFKSVLAKANKVVKNQNKPAQVTGKSATPNPGNTELSVDFFKTANTYFASPQGDTALSAQAAKDEQFAMTAAQQLQSEFGTEYEAAREEAETDLAQTPVLTEINGQKVPSFEHIVKKGALQQGITEEEFVEEFLEQFREYEIFGKDIEFELNQNNEYVVTNSNSNYNGMLASEFIFIALSDTNFTNFLDARNEPQVYIDGVDERIEYIDVTDTPEFKSFCEGSNWHEYLNNKYNLRIDFNQEITPEQQEKLQHAYVVETQYEQMYSTKMNMESYFNTLGCIDGAYDNLKDTFGFGITQEEIEEYCQIEEYKNQVLTSAISKNGYLDYSDIDAIKKVVKFNMQNMSTEELDSYVEECLGKNIEDFKREIIKQYLDLDCIIEGAYYDGESNEFVCEDINYSYEKFFGEDNNTELINLITNSLSIDGNHQISFEQAYQIANGVEYNSELMSNVMSSRETFAMVAGVQQSAETREAILKNATPQEALNYFDLCAEELNDGTTGEELFNAYYAEIFAKNPDILQNDINSMYVTGICIKDGYLWQELTFDENIDEEGKDLIWESDFLYKIQDKNGKDRYYKVVDIETGQTKSNIGDKEDIYYDDSAGSASGLGVFNHINELIDENNLYLNMCKDDFNSKYGIEGQEDAFNKILEEYPKMYEEAFGHNYFADKLNVYKGDMDTYSGRLSRDLSIACFIAGFIPGCQIAWYVPLAIAASDNAIDLININTSKQSESEKRELRKQLGINTLIEAAMIGTGMGINKFSSWAANNIVSNKIAQGSLFILNHAQTAESIIEYGIDNVASVGVDTVRGLVTGEFLVQNERGEYVFSPQKYWSMVGQDMIWNSVDLRNGMSLYKSISAGQPISMGNGVYFKIESDGVVKYYYDTGYEATITGGDEIIGSVKPIVGEDDVPIKFDMATRTWTTPDGTTIALTSKQFANVSLNNTKPYAAIVRKALWGTPPSTTGDFENNCAFRFFMNECETNSFFGQALEYGIDYDPITKLYSLGPAGDGLAVELKPGESLIDKFYEQYHHNYPESSEGDFVQWMFRTAMGENGATGNIIAAYGENVPLARLRELTNDETTALMANCDTGEFGLTPHHVYKVVEVNETDGTVRLQDVDSQNGETVTLAQADWERMHFDGISFRLDGIEDGSGMFKVAATKKTSNIVTPPAVQAGNTIKIDGTEYTVVEVDENCARLSDGNNNDQILMEDIDDGAGHTIRKLDFDNGTVIVRYLGDGSQEIEYNNGKIIVSKPNGEIYEYNNKTDRANNIYKLTKTNGDTEEHLANGHVKSHKAGDPADAYNETWYKNGIKHTITHNTGDPTDKYVETWKTNDQDVTIDHESDTQITVTRKIIKTDPNTKKTKVVYTYTEVLDTSGKFFKVTRSDNPNLLLKYPVGVEPDYGSGITYGNAQKIHTTCRDNGGNFVYDFGYSNDKQILTGVHTYEAMQELIDVANGKNNNLITLKDGSSAQVAMKKDKEGTRILTVTCANGDTTYIKISGDINHMQGVKVSFSETYGAYGNPKSLRPQAVYDAIEANRQYIGSVPGLAGASYFVVNYKGTDIYFEAKGKTIHEVIKPAGRISIDLKSIPIIVIK